MLSKNIRLFFWMPQTDFHIQKKNSHKELKFKGNL